MSDPLLPPLCNGKTQWPFYYSMNDIIPMIKNMIEHFMVSFSVNIFTNQTVVVALTSSREMTYLADYTTLGYYAYLRHLITRAWEMEG